MSNHLAETEKWFRSELVKITALTACVESRISTQVAHPKATFPRLVFTVTPLKNNQGQRGMVLQSRFLIDAIIYAEALNFPDSVDLAIAAMNEHFENSALVRSTASAFFSISNERPINLLQRGTVPDQQIIARGTSFKVWASTINATI